ncbi:MAG: hypothetical protein IJE00_03015 [Clostridia bacterium]|nr:hypothetical protein [Clostridia bacterium]
MKNILSKPVVAQQFLDIVPSMRYDGKEDFADWQARAYAKLWERLGLDYMIPAEDDAFEWGEVRELEEGIAKQFFYQSEPGYFVPGWVLMPYGMTGKRTACICLQGHSTGVHNSLAMDMTPEKKAEVQAIDRDFGLRAVKEGYVAICIEQRYMGVCGGTEDGQASCIIKGEAMPTLMLGRCTIGERVWDVMRLVDVIEKYMTDFADTEKLTLMGNSGGGTATFYSACIEKRIQYAMPSCSVCGYKESIVDLWHCACNYIPGIARDFDMGDLGGLIAPRGLVVVHGKEDPIFPDAGVRRVYAEIERLYAAAGAPDRCRLVTGPGEHRFFADLSWPVMHDLQK